MHTSPAEWGESQELGGWGEGIGARWLVRIKATGAVKSTADEATRSRLQRLTDLLTSAELLRQSARIDAPPLPSTFFSILSRLNWLIPLSFR